MSYKRTRDDNETGGYKEPPKKLFEWAKKKKNVDEHLTQEDLQKKVNLNLTKASEMEETRIRRQKERRELADLLEQAKHALEIEASMDSDRNNIEMHRINAWKRTQIRIRDNRSVPVDHLMKYLYLQLKLTDPERLKNLGIVLGESEREIEAREQFVDSLDVDMVDIDIFFSSLDLSSLSQLREDVQEMIRNCGPPISGSDVNPDIDNNYHEREFWYCVLFLVDRYIDILKVKEFSASRDTPGETNRLTNEQARLVVACCLPGQEMGFSGDRLVRFCNEPVMTGSGLDYDVVRPVLAQIADKSYAQCVAVEKEIATKVAEEENISLLKRPTNDWFGLHLPLHTRLPPPESPVLKQDAKGLSEEGLRPVGYWRGLHKELLIHIAAVKLEAMNVRMMKMRLIELDMERKQKQLKMKSELAILIDGDKGDKEEGKGIKSEISLITTPQLDHLPPPPPTFPLSSLQPKPFKLTTLKQQTAMVDRVRQAANKALAQETVDLMVEQWRQRVDEDVGAIDETQYKTLDQDEEFLKEESLTALSTVQTYKWQDKYRPRRPKYVNKVKTGFSWNKYNQAHFDKDNPPPKVVMGYRFNIFYPDLIDSSVAPKYTISPDPSSVDFVILKFTAGAPYEDVAFKIVNKKWNLNANRGFVSVFQKGVLSLHFNFQRVSYRR